MPQQPTEVQPYLLNKARGLNDFVDPLKLKEGFVPFALNYNTSGDTWPRRSGRDLYWLKDGNPVELIDVVPWADGSSNYISLMGSTMYDITPFFSYYFRGGGRLILQSPGGNYWNCTPGFTTGQINPTTITTPTATPRTSNIIVSYGHTIAFQVDGGSIQLLSDFQNQGWYTYNFTDELGFTQYVSDVVFTYSSGYSLIIQDSALNNWKFGIDNQGAFYCTIT